MSRVAGNVVGAARREAERETVLRAARANRHRTDAAAAWGVLAAGAQFLRESDDAEVRAACTKAAGLLGIRDAIEVDVLVGRARANLRLVGGLDVEAAIEAWRARGDVYFRAADGNVVRSPGGCDDPASWEWVADLRAMAAGFCREHLAEGALRPLGPVTVEGTSPPWLLLALHEALPRLADGYWPLLQVVQRDVAELAEGFALAELSAVLTRSRVFAGEDAAERLADFVRARFDYPATGAVIPQGGVRLHVHPPIGDLVRTLAAEQKAEAMRLHRELLRVDRGRDDAYWSTRLSEPGTRRVLIPTCRYSTFIQHASRDLAETFEDLGWEARVLIEPDDHSRFSTIAYHRAQLEFDPDLIVLMNYPRASRAEAFPAQTPFVCWVQDAMPHLFDERVGRGHGPRDFVVGHVYPKLFREFGYPAERASNLPVVASARKFHGGAISAARRARYACEMAYVSHHSETPSAMHARLCAEAGDPTITSVLNEMRRLLGERYGAIVGAGSPGLAKSIPGDAWARVHAGAPTPRVLAQLREGYLVPILERVVRHEMLEWAAAIADRRGWSLKIYGKGWEGHGTLGRFAAGPLDHGEDLRAAYQAATVHLHASMTTLVHQRVMECALSGGLAICRLIEPNLGASRQAALYALVAAGTEPDEMAKDGSLGFRTEAHEPLRKYGATLASLGMGAPAVVRLHPGVAAHMRRYGPAFQGATAEQLLGDLGQSCFRSAQSLETLVHALVRKPELRSARSESMALRVRERFTHEAAAGRICSLVQGSILGSGEGGRAA